MSDSSDIIARANETEEGITSEVIVRAYPKPWGTEDAGRVRLNTNRDNALRLLLFTHAGCIDEQRLDPAQQGRATADQGEQAITARLPGCDWRSAEKFSQ